MSYVIGVDLGTSAVKTVLVDPSGKVVAEHSESYPLSQPKPGYSERDRRIGSTKRYCRYGN